MDLFPYSASSDCWIIFWSNVSDFVVSTVSQISKMDQRRYLLDPLVIAFLGGVLLDDLEQLSLVHNTLDLGMSTIKEVLGPFSLNA